MRHEGEKEEEGKGEGKEKGEGNDHNGDKKSVRRGKWRRTRWRTGGREEVAEKIVVKRKKSGTSAVSIVSGPVGDWHSA